MKTALEHLLRSAIASVIPGTTLAEIPLERPRQADHGDYASSIALQLAKAAKSNPRELAIKIKASLPASDFLESCDIAGPGFLNFKLRPAARFSVVADVLSQPVQFGRLPPGSKGRIQVEFVSSNPTGPLHVGHGRGAAFGASLANLLDFAGWSVQREYYVNDAGRQMDILAVSTWLRYLNLHSIGVAFPPNGYQGDYVSAMAQDISRTYGDRFVHSEHEVLAGCPGIPDSLSNLPDAQRDAQIESHMDALIFRAKQLLNQDWAVIHASVLADQLADCRADLEEFGVVFDCWFSEQSLYDSGRVARVVARLNELGHLYTQDGALWFKSSAFGDEKDRVVQRENGIYTYFASDIAYHDEKFGRGFDRILNVWGADHHGYIPRVRAALIALGHDADRLVVPLVQFVSLFRNGEKVQMSTRKGQFVTLRALREETGRDAARFFYVLRKSDQALDFDLSLATSESNDNPVYYVQYAHARVHSVLAKWGGNPADLIQANLSLLGSESEIALAQVLAQFSETIEQAATDLAPHSIAFYLRELAAAFHSCYNSAPFILSENEDLSRARLALAYASATVLKQGLLLLGVSAPNQM